MPGRWWAPRRCCARCWPARRPTSRPAPTCAPACSTCWWATGAAAPTSGAGGRAGGGGRDTEFRPIPRDREPGVFRFDDGWLTRVISWFRPRYQTFNPQLAPADVGPLTVTARALDHTALALLPPTAFRAEADSLRAPPARRRARPGPASRAARSPRPVKPRAAARPARPPRRAARRRPPLLRGAARGGRHHGHRRRRALRADGGRAGPPAPARVCPPPRPARQPAGRRRPTTCAAPCACAIYGLGGNDEFDLNGRLAPGFGVHLYGGAGRNVFLQQDILAAAGRWLHHPLRFRPMTWCR
ncbi:MAG: hypothetical protein WKG07_17520 [Hymenobacter sp.]